MLVYSLSIELATHSHTKCKERICKHVPVHYPCILSGIVCYIAELLQGHWLSTSVMMTFMCDDDFHV